MMRSIVAVTEFLIVAWVTIMTEAAVKILRVALAPAGGYTGQRGHLLLDVLPVAMAHPIASLKGTWLGSTGPAAMYLTIVYGCLAWLWAYKGWPRWVAGVALLAALVGQITWLVVMLSGFASFGMQVYDWAIHLGMLGLVTLVALLIHRLFTKRVRPWAEEFDQRRRPASRRRKPGPVNLGFTLIEVLVVIAIVTILAAIAFTVLRPAKESAYKTREIAQIRQVYLAVNLYEGDNDRLSPSSLPLLIPTYLPAAGLKCPLDARLPEALPDWPANPWVVIEPPDPPEVVKARAPFMNSYFYLKTFEARFAAGHSYDEYRNDPKVGLVTGVGLMRCNDGACKYSRLGGSGQPASNLWGDLVTVRTDGSIVSRHVAEGCPGQAIMGHPQLFFFASLGCGQASISQG